MINQINDILRYILYPTKKVSKELKKNKDLINMRTSEEAYILATGPSINNMDLSFLEGKDCFSVSNFFLHKDIKRINPKLHFFAPYHEPLIREDYINWLKMADTILPSKTGIVLCVGDKKFIENNSVFEKRKIYWIDYYNLKYIKTNILKPVMAAQTGPIMILPVVDFMGYQIMNLVGCDMNTLKNYGEKKQNFYDKDPRKNATDANAWEGIIYELQCARNAFMQFKLYNDYFTKKHKKMYNLSKESWLDFIEFKEIKQF